MKKSEKLDAHNEAPIAFQIPGKLRRSGMSEGTQANKTPSTDQVQSSTSITDRNGIADEALASIQPLPERAESSAPSPAGVRSHVGAFAISPGLRPTDGPENSSGSTPNTDLEAHCTDENRLVEAQLVDNTVVHAENLKHSPAPNNKIHWLLMIACLVILVLLAIVVTLAVLSVEGKERGTSTGAGLRNSTSYNEKPTPGETVADLTAAPTPATSAPTSAPTCPQCFEDGAELYHAMNAYYQDPSPNSSVALLYGHPIGTWLVSQVTNFNYLLSPSNRSASARSSTLSISEEGIAYATNFSNDLSSWDMSGAKRLEHVFSGMQRISSSLGIQAWDVSNTQNMRGLFKDTHWTEDPLNLNSWNTSQVSNLNHFFQYSNVQKAGLSNWDTSCLKELWEFAEGATQFNENLGNWNVQRITSMTSAFEGASSFNVDLSRWKTHSLHTLNLAFKNAASFNQPLQDWDVSRVHSLGGLFQGSIFNQPLEEWDISECTITRQTFADNPTFNQPLGKWDVSRVVDARWMFERASNFSQNLCSWASKLPPNANVTEMFQQTNCPNTSDPNLEEGGP